ncbi:MAG: helix-turn-helix transcriptional regulator [Paraperlucidibaca sp.]|nr:helix-turn-helix transcriptional regulator [Paraperlucidibaca sp.]MBQ0722951.1 helix-turn-helix transcriptional regulator [Paraperlucidibaca sp.]MBQ0842411.1 helix-turn-helix transcriptional regulator [Paraperlucidibaca sp.]|tara:strand:+ start:292 stop:651 length:360 start_codon:yes stop_codon:yes gene_type:complete
MKPNHPFSTRLKAARLAKSAMLKAKGLGGYSQEKLGCDTGIEEATASARMNQYEQGKHLPDLQQAARFAEALDVPLAYLFCLDDDIAELLLLTYSLPHDQRQQVTEFALQILTSNNISK